MALQEPTEWRQSMEWNDEYLIGHHAVDDDHKRLFELFNQFSAAVRGGQGAAAIHPFLDELVHYARYHFAREEALMRRLGYPDLAHHHDAHQAFVRQVNGIVADVDAGKSMDDFLLNFVMTWLSGHILILDKRVGEWILTK